MILGGPAMKTLLASLNSDENVAVFKSGSLTVRVLLWTDTGTHDSARSEKFTSEEDGYDSSDESSEPERDSENNSEDLMLCLLKDHDGHGTVMQNKALEEGLVHLLS